MKIEEVRAFASTSELGFDAVKKIGKWHGYEVYQAYLKGFEKGLFGYPCYILVKNGKMRFSTLRESKLITRDGGLLSSLLYSLGIGLPVIISYASAYVANLIVSFFTRI